MSRPEPLQPVYDFSSAPKPISLLHGAVEVDLGNDKFSGTADLLLRFLPSPHLIFQARVQCSLDLANSFFLRGVDDPSFSFNGQTIKGFCGGWRPNPDVLEFDWHPQCEPVALCDMQSKTSVEAILHLFNFPDYRGGQDQVTAAPPGCALLVLESKEWRISLQSLPNNATYEACKKIKEEGGCFLTHVAKLKRKDSKPFSGEQASVECLLLDNFFSFTKGGTCSTVCEVGFDASGHKTWESFASPSISNPPYSWFNVFEASQAEIFFPMLAKRWHQSKEWQDCLSLSIYWYVQANTNGASLGIDSAIILAQSALERLAYQYLVVDQNFLSLKRFKDQKASDRLRLLFSKLNIPIGIGSATPDLQKSATKWVDAPHAITEIRNELVHPVSRNQVADCFIDAWKLSLWYLELCILGLCGYQGTYISRLTSTSQTHSENVPWA